MRFHDRHVIVTGGNSGIGLAAARRFLAEGARVTITGRNQESLDQAASELGPNLLALRADVADVAALEGAFRAAHRRFGAVHALFANAGLVRPTPLGQTTLEQFEEVIRTNVTGVFFTVQAALPWLADRAAIVLNGSIIPQLGGAGQAAYSASKAGVVGLMTAFAAELSPRGIRVNTVVPGATKTPIWSVPLHDQAAVRALEERLNRSIPLGRMSEADEVAKAAVFLASDDASSIQATSLVVDGGTIGIPLAAPIYR